MDEWIGVFKLILKIYIAQQEYILLRTDKKRVRAEAKMHLSLSVPFTKYFLNLIYGTPV